ncbi:hypothetical protein ACGFXC_33035 [Streptomyces sp. NPDC048507]|uniref:hypothetical protein n=1 Tax=Streptomyces sp. NPDC048507 TaxID=3365560 RepID=UPI003715152C
MKNETDIDGKGIHAMQKCALAFTVLAICIGVAGIFASGGSAPVCAMLGALIIMTVVSVAALRSKSEDGSGGSP